LIFKYQETHCSYYGLRSVESVWAKVGGDEIGEAFAGVLKLPLPTELDLRRVKALNCFLYDSKVIMPNRSVTISRNLSGSQEITLLICRNNRSRSSSIMKMVL